METIFSIPVSKRGFPGDWPRKNSRNTKPRDREQGIIDHGLRILLRPGFGGQGFTQMGRSNPPTEIQPRNTRTTRTGIFHGAKGEWCRGNWLLTDENNGGGTESGSGLQKLSHQVGDDYKGWIPIWR